MTSREHSGKITLPYGEGSISFSIGSNPLLKVVSPRAVSSLPDPGAEVRRALSLPIRTEHLSRAVAGKRRILMVIDDLTRRTPLKVILPALLEEMHRGGIRDEQITLLVALGTHRPMSGTELEQHLGREILDRVRVVNHCWQDPASLIDLGTTPAGSPIRINRLALQADFLLGVGSIVPHHIPGFSGGTKIIQPGISGPETTGWTHILSTRSPRSLLGRMENPVRKEMDRIGEQVGLKAILNVVLSPEGGLLETFYGHPVHAHRSGVARSRQVFGVAIPGRADIVVAGSHPCDIEFWQAHKTLYPAEMAVKPGGTIILVTPCPEGVSVTHHHMLEYTGLHPARIERLIADRELRDSVSAALALAWAKVRQHAAIHLVSGGISREEACCLGFTPFDDVQSALDAAIARHGSEATITVMTHAPDTLPLL